MSEKAIRLVEYLLALASLRTKVVRDIADYERVLWLNDIPTQKGCFTQAREKTDGYDSDIWVEVKNEGEPKLPSVPSGCKDWINKSALQNKAEIPEPLPEIKRRIRNPDWRDGNDQPEFIQSTEHLKDHPEVREEWDLYVEEQWLTWLDKHNAWESVNKVYTELFAIHQEQLRLGEEYELVLGLGLLTWQTPTGQRVHRHLIVANALLEFEASSKKFTVRPNPDGAKVRLELDMLEIQYQPKKAQDDAETKLTEAADDPWEKTCIEEVLKTLVHSIDPQGGYDETLGVTNVQATTKPTARYAPAIILRKRSTKGLTEVLNRIKDKIAKGEEIPTAFGDLAEIAKTNDPEHDKDPGDSVCNVPVEIYFPKPSNKEQRGIVNKIQVADGVLVQGPPGTGKSHTIANLICHLLATGQRILVTAKTPRALRVLEGLLPQEILPLSINLLGEGLEEKRSLESSVGGILRKHQEWKKETAQGDIQLLGQKIRQLREEKAEKERRLREIRESETHEKSFPGGQYRGTASQIAQAVKANEKMFEWFKDTIQPDKACPSFEAYLPNVLKVLRQLTLSKRRELSLKWPKMETLPSPERFADLVKVVTEAIEKERAAAQEADPQATDQLVMSNADSIRALLDLLSALINKRRTLLARPFSWLSEAVRDISSNSALRWCELSKLTREFISSVSERVALADATELEILEKVNLKAILDDTLKIKTYMEDGRKLSWRWFRPKHIKQSLNALETLRVNGQVCTSLPQFQLLADVLPVHIGIENGWRLWAGRCEKCSGPFSLQLNMVKDHCNTLDEALSLENEIKACQDSLERCGGLAKPIWNDEQQVYRLMQSCSLALTRHDKDYAINELRQIEAPLAALVSEGNAHPVLNMLLDAIRNRDVAAFTNAYDKNQRLEKDRSIVEKFNENLVEFRSHVPRLSGDLENTCKETYWEKRIQQICSAWYWAQSKTWLEKYIKKEDAHSLSNRVKQIEDEIGDNTAEIASLLAWSFCLSRLQGPHRQHMIAWQQAMKHLGKGTGKHAFWHRREAQKHLNGCREAVPAWVMPLHRVWDTVDIAPGMFDVIIVDEASQCGLEAVPLFYLSKKLLIVGDDKQISPEAVGFSRDDVHDLMKKYLFDFSFYSSFEVEMSIFDLGYRLYGKGHITLREHFRCMPEIIRFSNDLCYSETPLIPLRQYGQDRVSPIERVFVEDGCRQGEGIRVVNYLEADEVVKKIVELCDDPKYAGKTMGVVVLQGEAQAGLIENNLLKQLGAEEMGKRRLICGNPYSFQGDERDIMFLSMVAAPDERIGTLTKEADKRRFNVAASRAKDQMWLFHSVRRGDLSPSCLRRKLLEFFEGTTPTQISGIKLEELELKAEHDNRVVIKPPSPFDSWFEVDVALELLRRDYFVIPQFEIAGKRIDLVVEGGLARLAIECDGDKWHGADRFEEDMQRQRMLERCGWEFFRVRASAFYWDRARALNGLWRMLEERNITPGWSVPFSLSQDEDKMESDMINKKKQMKAKKKRKMKYLQPKTPKSSTEGSVGDQRKYHHQRYKTLSFVL